MCSVAGPCAPVVLLFFLPAVFIASSRRSLSVPEPTKLNIVQIWVHIEGWYLLVQDNIQEGSVDVETAFVVLDEAEFPEFVHEEIDPARALSRSFPPASLAILWEAFFWLVLLAIASEQQKSAGQPFLAGVKELIDQILLNADVP